MAGRGKILSLQLIRPKLTGHKVFYANGKALIQSVGPG
jgi:hypothetical protein